MENRILLMAETGSDITPEPAKELGIVLILIHIKKDCSRAVLFLLCGRIYSSAPLPVSPARN